MINYYSLAWEKLLKARGLSVGQLLQVVNSLGIEVSANTFITWRTHGTIPPLHLIAICNHFRFPISYFTRIEGHEAEHRDYRLFSEAEWTDIHLETHRLIDFASKVSRRLRCDAIEKLKCSPAYYDALRKYPSVPLPKKLTFVGLLGYINNIKIYPGDVICDANEPLPMEYGIRPFYDNAAMLMYDNYFPQQEASFVADEIIDTKEFLMRYVISGRLAGDENVIGMSVHTINEIASIITNLRDENLSLRQRIDKLSKRE